MYIYVCVKSSLPQGPSMARCKTGLRPRSELSNPPFLCLHEWLAGRDTENESVNVVINATFAMQGILTPQPLPEPCIIDSLTFYGR